MIVLVQADSGEVLPPPEFDLDGAQGEDGAGADEGADHAEEVVAEHDPEAEPLRVNAEALIASRLHDALFGCLNDLHAGWPTPKELVHHFFPLHGYHNQQFFFFSLPFKIRLFFVILHHILAMIYTESY